MKTPPALWCAVTGIFVAATMLAAQDQGLYRIRTTGCTLEMRVLSSVRYSGEPVFFYPEERGQERFCLSADGDLSLQDCAMNFVGAMAMVRFFAQPESGRECSAMREHVRVIDQSAEMDTRAPYERTIPFRGREASDIQLYGFTGREIRQNKTSRSSWRMFRQELFLDGHQSPFLIVHWKHTPAAIELMDVIPTAGTEIEERSRHRK